MKKILYLVLLAVLAPSLSAAPVLVETYNEGTITIPETEIDTVTAVELSFSVDTSCYVLFTAGGLARRAKMFLCLDGNNLFPTSFLAEVISSSFHIVYAYPLSSGTHNVHFRLTNIQGGASADCSKAYLQALIFLPDEPGAVMEAPPGNNPQSRVHSVVSRGPWVSAPGATELVDASGRVIENAIVAERVQISTLPAGTYFARDGERTVVKIVKVD